MGRQLPSHLKLHLPGLPAVDLQKEIRRRYKTVNLAARINICPPGAAVLEMKRRF